VEALMVARLIFYFHIVVVRTRGTKLKTGIVTFYWSVTELFLQSPADHLTLRLLVWICHDAQPYTIKFLCSKYRNQLHTLLKLAVFM
jgi:hypothetical protein